MKTEKPKKRIKILGLKQLFNKSHKVLQQFATLWSEYFGLVEDCCIIFIWGRSGSGKSEYLMQLVKDICCEGIVLYVGLEERARATMKARAKRYLSEEIHAGKVKWWDDDPSYELLFEYLSKRQSPKIIVIDSIQYLRISYDLYVKLKEAFPRKIFIIVSHATGKEPKGATADSIRYDADIKVFVEGKMAFVDSRYGGHKNYVIWEEGAIKYWNKREFEKLKKR